MNYLKLFQDLKILEDVFIANKQNFVEYFWLQGFEITDVFFKHNGLIINGHWKSNPQDIQIYEFDLQEFNWWIKQLKVEQ